VDGSYNWWFVGGFWYYYLQGVKFEVSIERYTYDPAYKVWIVALLSGDALATVAHGVI